MLKESARARNGAGRFHVGWSAGIPSEEAEAERGHQPDKRPVMRQGSAPVVLETGLGHPIKLPYWPGGGLDITPAAIGLKSFAFPCPATALAHDRVG
jgi:hypothetical protein